MTVVPRPIIPPSEQPTVRLWSSVLPRRVRLGRHAAERCRRPGGARMIPVDDLLTAPGAHRAWPPRSPHEL